jgi:hypothetical protein
MSEFTYIPGGPLNDEGFFFDPNTSKFYPADWRCNAISDDGVRINTTFGHEMILYEINGEQYIIPFEYCQYRDEMGKISQFPAQAIYLSCAFKREEENNARGIVQNKRRQLPTELLSRMHSDLIKAYAVIGGKCFIV